MELGCGNGILWSFNKDTIPKTWDITLSDYSPGMVSAAKNAIGDAQGNIAYRVIDAEKIMYPEEAFDMVIANNMLYHVHDKESAFTEIGRVLKGGGVFWMPAGKGFFVSKDSGMFVCKKANLTAALPSRCRAEILEGAGTCLEELNITTLEESSRLNTMQVGLLLSGHLRLIIRRI